MPLRPCLTSAFVALAACSQAGSNFPVDAKAQQATTAAAETPVQIIRISARNIADYSQPRATAGDRTTVTSGSWIYRIGAGDILDIVVWNHPDLTLPAGEKRSPQDAGSRVEADGTFFYPHVGAITARGKTVEAVRRELTTRLAEFIPNPQVQVRVAAYNSQALSVTGAVQSPNRQKLTDIPLTLLEAIDGAGGLTPEADARKVTLRRAGKSYNIDLQSFLSDGIGANNPLMQAGDVISVPKAIRQEAYLLGQLAKPATVDLTRENVTLTQALTRVGGVREDIADARGIFVFRNTTAGVTVHQLDASNPAGYLLGARFVLMPEDVVYVTTAPVARWNRVISNLLPSLTTVRAADLIGAP